jgi:hypothetical protein
MGLVGFVVAVGPIEPTDPSFDLFARRRFQPLDLAC